MTKLTTPAEAPVREPPRARPLLWLAGGLLLGGVATTAVVLLAMQALRAPEPAALPAPRFVAQPDSGIDQVYDGEFQFFVGGGVAVLDCDADGLQDLYVAGGVNPAALYRNQSPAGGELRFAAVPAAATALTSVTGAYPIDIDSDGITDLAVLRVGENAFLRGTGDCGFEWANEEWSIDGGDEWTVAFSATWEGDAALPTMAIGNYLTSESQTGGGCEDSFLLRPAEGGDGYTSPQALRPGWCTLSILFSDWSRTGQRDLRMTNDRHYYRDGEEQLWDMSEPTPRIYTREDGWQELRIWGMGIASQDITGDGLPEVYLTSQGDNKLQTLVDGPSRPEYEDIALERGANAHRPFVGADQFLPSTAWHAQFEDVNNDGLWDLFVAKGNVEAQPEYAGDDPNNLLIGQPGGTFLEAALDAGIVSGSRSRGAALADFNQDGLLDLVTVNRRSPVEVWRNVGSGTAGAPASMGHWLGVRLQQQGPNRDAIGSWIEVRAGEHDLSREVTIGGGHAGGQLGWSHFGTGDAVEARVRVTWPDGERSRWFDLRVDRLVTIDRAGDEAVS